MKNWEIILNVLLAIAAVVLAFVGYYFYVRNKIQAALNGEISDEENSEAKAEAKRQEVVDRLQALVPAVLKPFLTQKVLTALVQAAFDKIEEYAKKQAAKKASSQDAPDNKE